MGKKIKKIFIIALVILLFYSIVCKGAIYFNTDAENIKIRDEIQFVLDFNETVQTADFSIYFDSDKLTYIGSSTNLDVNYIEEKKEMICCYYDLNKVGTDKILFKFKAKDEANKTNIKITNITVHTNNEEKQIEDTISENIKIEKDSVNNNTSIDKTENSNTSNTTNEESNEQQNNNTKVIKSLPKAGEGFGLRELLIIALICIILMVVIKDKKIKRTVLFVIIIGTAIVAILNELVFAVTEDKIYINKKDKTILIVLSTSNEKRSMTLEEFKNRTKATSINDDVLKSGVVATFSNNEKYTIYIFRDENKNGYVNSGDIFELLNKENINKEDIIEVSNFIIRKEEFKSYSNLPQGYEEFNDKSIVTPSVTPLEPAVDRYTSVKNIEELKKIDAKVGDKYKTEGYYEQNDGGAGRYDIIEKTTEIKVDEGLYVELNNGLLAKLAIINNTVNVKQFGAKGNGISDDVKHLNTAFNSGIPNIELQNGEYKITDIIKINTPNTNIIGNNSTIFTNDEYNPEVTSEFLFIMHSDNCNINNLKIEARETKKIDKLYKAQVYVGATNIKIIGCEFNIPETTSSECSYSNIDLYTGWHNVLIENCNLYLANDAKEGGCIWIRDLFNRGASDVTFKNNKCYKKCHDEILAVFMGSIENVNILNNEFIMADSTDPSVMAFTLGSGSSKKADNIRFEGNTIDVKTTMDIFVSRNATNLSIKNNKIKYERVTTLTNTFAIYFPENNGEHIEIENNNFEINNKTGVAINGLISSWYSNMTFSNNTVTVNSDISEVFTGGFKNTNNEITFNGKVKILANKPKDYTDNHVIFNKGFGSIAQYYNGNIEWDSNIKNNVFENNFDELASEEKSILLMFNGGSLNNHIVNFEGNTVKSEKANYKSNLIYLLNLADKESQTIKIINNKIDGYKMGWKDKNQDIHKIVLE